MNLDNINFRAKDAIHFCAYIVSLTVLFLSLSSKVDNLAASVCELKDNGKESSGENKAEKFILQNEIKTLSIRAELNKQNIEIMQKDIELLKIILRTKNE